ncbi:hypothetical protein N665_1182s0003 [Sinapis alba]|nr:hypothetical protein N665_1182s0003 [Sinapis alba]
MKTTHNVGGGGGGGGGGYKGGGGVGQSALEEASIFLLNCGPTGSEALKNLVLGGVGSITIVDGSNSSLETLETISWCDERSVGESKSKSTCAFLQELNDAVNAKFVEENPDYVDYDKPFFLLSVIATQLLDFVSPWSYSMVKLDRICLEENVKLIFVRSYGLVGLVRMSVKDFVKSKMIYMDDDNYKEAIEAAFKVFAPHGISKKFVSIEGDGEAPLEGALPDMTSSTEHYINLQKIYLAKAEADFLVMEKRIRNILKKIGRDPSIISKPTIKSFCKNTKLIRNMWFVCRYRMVEDEFSNPSVTEIQKCLADEDNSGAMGFYVLLRAVDRFTTNYNMFPGQFDGEMDENISWLKTTALSFLADLGLVAAFVGGITSQEVIKLVTKQFVPMLGTYIFSCTDHMFI